MWSSRKKITSIEGCPEFRLGVTLVNVFSQSPQSPAFFAPQDDPDRMLCVRNMQFETNGNADMTRDEPYLNVCIAGKCQKTSSDEHFGNAVCPCGDEKCGRGFRTYQWCYVPRSCPVADYYDWGEYLSRAIRYSCTFSVVACSHSLCH